MKKLRTTTIFLFVLFSSQLVSAAVNYNSLPLWNDPSSLIIKIINVILTLVIVVAVLFIIIGGIRYITASGSSDQIQSAKNSILYGVIGLIVAILSFAITNYIQQSLIK